MRSVALLSLCVLLLFSCGCASVHSLPKSANQVNFDARQEGKTGWSRYEEFATFESVDLKTVYEAAKAGLADAGFTLQKADYDNRVVMGEHGMTLYDWNVVAGIYMKEVSNGVEVKVHVEGSKDIGFMGDVTGDSWTGKILKGMRDYISERKESKRR